jgi:serine/threonine protein kinase
MSQSSTCPDERQLQDFATGCGSPLEIEYFTLHLDHCAVCASLLETVLHADPLVAALREGATELLLPCVPKMEDLLDRLRELPGPAAESAVNDPISEGPPQAAQAEKGMPIIPGYRLERKLGHGGMGVVYEAEQLALKRTVALKVILAGCLADAKMRTRFRGEAEAAASLQHANIVQIYDIGEHDGEPYFAMEFVQGGSLDEKLAGKPLPPREAAGLVKLLALAVQAAHNRKVVHRDLKPANILLSADGTPKIADFGLAKRLNETMIQTTTGAVLGTPHYMSPEQAAGRTAVIGPLSDVYALGAILYETLTGSPPFGGALSHNILLQVLGEEPVPPRQLNPQVPRDLETICLKCLEKKGARRYASADALAKDLRNYLDGKPISARPLGRMARFGRWCWRHPFRTGATVFLAASLGLASLVAMQWWLDRDRRDFVQQLDILLAAESVPEPDKDKIQGLLHKLASIDTKAALGYGETYLDKMLQLNKPHQEARLTASDIERIDRLVAVLTDKPSANLGQIRQPARWERFRKLIAPYLQSISLYSLLKHDPNRIPNLQRLARIAMHLGSADGIVEVRFELMRGYWAEGMLPHAMEIASNLLDQADLAKEWRTYLLRDYVWLALQSADPLRSADARDRVDKALYDGEKVRPKYHLLLVEKARLLLAQKKIDQAKQTLEIYFRGNLNLNFNQPINENAMAGAVPRINVPVVFYFDAVLLKGFLLAERRHRKDAETLWKETFAKTQATNVRGYYEAALLGSLSSSIGLTDAMDMVLHTLQGAGDKVDALLAARIAEEMGKAKWDRQFGAGLVLTTVLNEAWQSNRGREFARQIAFRQMAFGEFANAQIRLWLFELLKLAANGRKESRPYPSEQQSNFLWQLAQDTYKAYSEGGVKEQLILDLFLFVALDKELDQWPQFAQSLPERLRCPYAYVLGRHFHVNCHRPKDARWLLNEALLYADKCSSPDTARALIAAANESIGQ